MEKPKSEEVQEPAKLKVRIPMTKERKFKHAKDLTFFVANHMAKVNEATLNKKIAELTDYELIALLLCHAYRDACEHPQDVEKGKVFTEQMRMLRQRVMNSFGKEFLQARFG